MSSREQILQSYNRSFGNCVERFRLKEDQSHSDQSNVINSEIFISRIDHEVTAEELLYECIKYGDVVDLRLIRYASESLAFVRFSTETDLNNALDALNGLKLQQHNLKAVRSEDVKIVDLQAPDMQLQDITKLLVNTVYGEVMVEKLPETFHYKLIFTTHDSASSFRYCINNAIIKGFTTSCHCDWIYPKSVENVPATRKRKASELTQEEIGETSAYIYDSAINEYRKHHDGNIPSQGDNIDVVHEFYGIHFASFLPKMKKAASRAVLEQQKQKFEAFLSTESPKKTIEDYQKLLKDVLEMINTLSDSFKTLSDSSKDMKAKISKFIQD